MDKDDHLKELQEALQAIAEGYSYRIEEHERPGFCYVIVDNPSYQEDNGDNPCLVFEAH